MSKSIEVPKLVEGVSVKKTVYLRADDVFAEVYDRSGQLQLRFGPRAKPVRVLLGPNQYLLVCEFHRTNPRAFGITGSHAGIMAYPETILGIPVGLKQSNGIEFEFSSDMVMELAHGRIE